MSRRILIADTLRQVTTLAGLDRESVLALAAEVVPRTFAAGGVLIQAGTGATGCFVLERGRAEVTVPGSAPVQIGPGTVVGESGLLTDEPRNATVRASEPSTALEIPREAFLAAITSDRDLAWRVVDLMRLRERPKRDPQVEVYDRMTVDGDFFTILKHPATGNYFRLSFVGRFVWERLDGNRNVRDLALGYLESGHGFAPQAITDVAARASSGS